MYIDDILVYSASIQEHMETLVFLLNRLMKAGYRLNLDKCEFLQEQIKYLGFVIDKDGVRPDPLKMEVLANTTVPKTKKEVKSFLAMVNYYRSFFACFV